jgi:hypothetical protein
MMPRGNASDGLPLEDYDSLSAHEIADKLKELSPEEIERLCHYEKANENRTNLLRLFQDRIGAFSVAASKAPREDPPPGEERPERRGKAPMGRIAREDPPQGEERPERRAQ